MSFGFPSSRVVAIVTGGSFPTGRDIARALARRGWHVVIVYLEHQSRTGATVTEIITTGGAAIAVRADLADDLDVQRLFTESTVEFGGVDIVVHTTSGRAALLCDHAARHVRRRGAIILTSEPEPITPQVAAHLRERAITVERVPPHAVLAHLDRWRQQNLG